MSRHAPAVLAAVLQWLPVEPTDPITGQHLAENVSHTLGRRVIVRRVEEAIEALREEGVPVASLSSRPAGYRIAVSKGPLRACLREFDRRIFSLFRRRKSIRRMLAVVGSEATESRSGVDQGNLFG